MLSRLAKFVLCGILFLVGVPIAVGAGDATDIQKLTKQLTDASATARAEAARAIGKLKRDDALPAVPALCQCVTDEDIAVRRAAVRTLRQIKPGPQVMIPLMAKVLGDAEPSVAVAAIGTIAEHGKQAVPGLVTAMGDERTRLWASLALATIGPDASEAVPALVEALGDEKPEVRREVVMALGAIGSGAAKAVPALRRMLADNDAATHLAVIYSLGKIGPAAAAATADLKKVAAADDPFTAVVASWSLVCLSPEDKAVRREAIRKVVRALRSEDRKVRQAAARALVDLPKPEGGNPAVRKEFEKLLAESSPEVIADALEAIAEIGPRAVSGLIVALKHKSVRAAVANVLGRMGPKAMQAVPALTEAFADSDAAARREILFALGRIGPEDASAVAAIIQAMEDEDENVRYSAVYALGKIGTPAAAGSGALKKNLVSEDAFFRMCSAWALAMVNPHGEDIAKLTVPLLVEALKHERAFARIEAADALGRLGEGAGSAAPALQAALQDPDNGVRQAAATALKQIGK